MEVINDRDSVSVIHSLETSSRFLGVNNEIYLLSKLYDQIEEQVAVDEDLYRPILNLYYVTLTGFMTKYAGVVDYEFIIRDIFVNTWLEFSFTY